MSKPPTDDPVALRRKLADLQATLDGARKIYRQAPVGLSRQDREFRYVDINEYLARINGLSVEQHLGQDMREILPQVSTVVESQMSQVFESGEPVLASTSNMETAAHPGSKRLYQYSLIPVKDANGKVRWLDSVVADITDVFAGYLRDFSRRETTEDLRSRFVERVFNAQEEQRKRIAFDLHDGVCQMLSAASLRIESVEPGSGVEDLAAVKTILRQSIDDIRGISRNLHPVILDDLGIVAAVSNVSHDFGESGPSRVDFNDSGFPDRLPADMQVHLFRIVQEALQNASKHSGAERITVTLAYTDETLHVRVEDDGAGFDPEVHSDLTSSGIMHMTERARFLGGQLIIDSAVGRGTKISLRVPWSPTE
jgi:PAS domain S-box-containing protein